MIQLNADMIELVLNEHDAKLNKDTSIDKAMTGLRKANQRAATIISTLRNMFGNGPKSISKFDFNELVKDVLLLCFSVVSSCFLSLFVFGFVLSVCSLLFLLCFFQLINRSILLTNSS